MTDNYSGKRLTFEDLRKLDAELDRQLSKGSGSRARSGSSESADRRRSRFSLRRILAALLFFTAAMLLPFLVLIRTSVYVYVHYAVNGWLALGAGVGGTVVLLLGYLLYAALRFRSWKWLNSYALRGVLLLVIAWCGYSLLYISSLNAKDGDVRSYYRSLHPVMRVAVATASIADPELVVTDIQRTAGDYRRMGLTSRQQSMHYLQDTGYVHAVDLRTLGRAEWKNFGMKWLFEGLGFETLRHTGTADHLHVYLPLNDS